MATPKKLFEITDQPLSLDDVAARVSRPNCGAVTTFAGIVPARLSPVTGHAAPIS